MNFIRKFINRKGNNENRDDIEKINENDNNSDKMISSNFSFIKKGIEDFFIKNFQEEILIYDISLLIDSKNIFSEYHSLPSDQSLTIDDKETVKYNLDYLVWEFIHQIKDKYQKYHQKEVNIMIILFQDSLSDKRFTITNHLYNCPADAIIYYQEKSYLTYSLKNTCQMFKNLRNNNNECFICYTKPDINIVCGVCYSIYCRECLVKYYQINNETTCSVCRQELIYL